MTVALRIRPRKRPRGYRPLGLRTLALQLLALAGAEVVLFRAYGAQQAGFHWSTHFLVGLTAAAVWNLLWLAVKAAPAPGQLLSILVFHLYAMFPDLLFAVGIPHERWMDVFLGHISVHYLPGEDASWLAIAVLSYGAYVSVLTAWLRARRREAECGMQPGIGIGGIALLRPQRDPAATPLAALRFGPERPADMLLLHGLGSSANLWVPLAEQLASNGNAIVAPDLLGFGRSRRIGTRFSLHDQVDALQRLIKREGAEQLEVIAHSYGCLVAVALVSGTPVGVRRLVLVSPPVFADPDTARLRLAQRSWLARLTLTNERLAGLACGLMCLGRGLLGRLAPWLARELPPELARDGLQHSWPAYRDSLSAIFADTHLPSWLERPALETVVVVADGDETTPPTEILGRGYDGVRVLQLPGGHLLPLTAAAELAEAIRE